MTLQHWNSMDTAEILCMLISKLRGNTRHRWNRNVLIIRRQHRREPELVDFIDFFEDETQLPNDPLFSREALRDYTEKADKGGNNKRRIKQYVGKNEESKRNLVMQKMMKVNSRKNNLQFVMKIMTLTIAVCSRIKHLKREAKYYGRKRCLMDVIRQYHKITMQKHVNREEHARSLSSFIQ